MAINRTQICVFKNICQSLAKDGIPFTLKPQKPILLSTFNGLKYVPAKTEIVPLNRTSEASEFFGVADFKKLNDIEHLIRHAYLGKICDRKGIIAVSGKDKAIGFIDAFFGKRRIGKNTQITSFWDLINGEGRLDPNVRAGKITFSGYEFEGKNALHTVGFVKKYDTLYIIDSLGHETPEQIKLHEFWKEAIEKYLKANFKVYPIIKFNKITQQSANELTCNNWTLENIEVLKNILEKKRPFSSQEELDAVLPRNINKILEKQMNAVIEEIQTNPYCF